MFLNFSYSVSSPNDPVRALSRVPQSLLSTVPQEGRFGSTVRNGKNTGVLGVDQGEDTTKPSSVQGIYCP